MILINESFESKNSLKLLDNTDLNKNGISEKDRIDLIGQVLLDERLSGTDTKLYMFLLNFENKGYRQEDLANILSLTRVSVNKSIAKLLAFNYISAQKSRRAVTEYKITAFSNAGVPTLDIDSLQDLYHLEVRASERFGKDDFDFEQEWNNFDSHKLASTSCLSVSQSELILRNKLYKFLLFTTVCSDFRVIKFKEKYLESIIRFHGRFVSTLDEVFFEAYYSLKKEELVALKDSREEGYYMEDIMKLFNVPNSSDKKKVEMFKSDILKEIDDFNDAYTYAFEKEMDVPSELKVLISRLQSRIKYSKQYTLEEMILIAYLGGYKYILQDKLSIVFEKFVMIINSDLVHEMNIGNDMLNRYKNRF